MMKHSLRRGYYLKKSKIEWLWVGDTNLSYFHKVVKGKTNRCNIHVVKGTNGGYADGCHVVNHFVQNYEQFLKINVNADDIATHTTMFTRRISHEKANHMIRQVTDEEVKQAMFSIFESNHWSR